MYFWNIKSLKNELLEGTLDQKSDLKYLIATLGLFSLASFPIGTTNAFDSYSCILELVLLILGTMLCFKSNGGETGKDFLRRYLSIGWVMCIRLIAVMLIFMIAFYSILEMVGYSMPDETSIVDLVFIVVFSLFFYWRLSVHLNQLRDVNN